MTTDKKEEEITFPLSDKELKARMKELSIIIKESEEKLNEACAYADKYHLEFTWDVGAYGMGGWYNGHPTEDQEGEHGWSASSSSC